MKLKKEMALENYMWKCKMSGQQIRTDTCLKKILDDYKITRIGPKKKQALLRMIRRVRERIKKRYAIYQANMRNLEKKGLCKNSLIKRWQTAGIKFIDPTDKTFTEDFIRVLVERDYTLAHGLDDDQIPIDPNVPIYRNR